jgi:lysylphosphatidylglycerol synthetase-like protein (DUF2156 family)
MTDSAILSMFFIAIIVAFSMIGITNLPNANTLDVRWVTATGVLVITVFVAFGAGWMWQIERNLQLLNRILTDKDDVLHPELKGIIQLLRQRLREIWGWGVPK